MNFNKICKVFMGCTKKPTLWLYPKQANYESIWQNTDSARQLSVQVSSRCETFYGARGRVHSWLYVNWVSSWFNMSTNLELRHPRSVCNIKVQCKEVKKHNKFMSVIMLLIERYVSAYSEAIIRFNYFQLYETAQFHGIH